MATPEFINVYPYQTEIVVEIGVSGPDTDLAVRSFQFEFCGEDQVTPKQEIAEQFQPAVEDALEERGYAVRSVA